MTNATAPTVPAPIPKYRMGQRVLNDMLKPVVIIGMLLEPEWEEDWDEINERMILNLKQAGWKYKTAYWLEEGHWDEWGWVKESEIEKLHNLYPEEVKERCGG